jgi:acetyltransferase-like isoleucine patch superfamily enzyme
MMPRVSRREALRKLPWRLKYEMGWRLTTRAKLLVIRATHRHCHVEFQGPVRLGPGFELVIPDAGTFIVGPGVDFRRGFVCELSGDARVEIGAGSTFTSQALLQCTTSITIGERCHFGQSLLIVDGNHRFRDPSLTLFEQGYDFRPVVIENDVAVTTKCSIIGAHIGQHSFIGANSVVSSDIPAYCLAFGAPARVADYFGPPELRPPDLPSDIEVPPISP